MVGRIRPPRAFAALLVALTGILAGCSASTAIRTSTTTHTTTSTTAPLPPTTTTTATTTPTRQPTLGSSTATKCQGCGQVEPSQINMEGDPTSVVSDVKWESWGSSQAMGLGTGWYVAPNQDTAQGRYQPVTVVAFNLGNCGSTYGYQAVTWYFPQHGEMFNSNRYYNTCTGADVQP